MTHTSPRTRLKLHSILVTVTKVIWLFWADSVAVGEWNTDHTADWDRFRQVEQEEQRTIRGACTSHARSVGEQDRSSASQTTCEFPPHVVDPLFGQNPEVHGWFRPGFK